ncbi:MAG: acetyl-coenzyme A synthetase N-terminal domain-containing protein, partial [Deltaproteobacteria bacterium]
MTDQIATLLSEDRLFPPPPVMVEQANGTNALYRKAKANREAFWGQQAGALEWISPWSRVLEWTPPHARWFAGGRLNVAANCLDRHLRTPRRNKVAILWEGEPGDRKVLTYWELAREV